MHRTGKSARVPWAFLFTLTAFLCAGFLSSAAAQSVAGTTWLSEKKVFGAFSTITFTADGRYSEIWRKRRPYGRWQASADNQQITVTLSNGKVLNFTFTADKNLIRANGQVVYKPTTAAAAATASTADETDSSPPAPDRNVPTVKLTEDQARAVVLIKGDNAEGTGFLVKTPDGPAVITNIHVISNNPNLKVTTNTDAPITILSIKGAADRDMVMMAIKDANYNYLTLATDISGTVQPGDEVITPGNSEGGEVMLNTDGKVLGIGPDRIEFDNPVYHGNSGGPVIHVKSGMVIGVVTEGVKVDVSDELDKASFANRNSAISHSMRYFGLRIDTVPNWEVYDWRRFQNETAFLDGFDKRSRCLDSYCSLLTASTDKKGQSTDDSEDAKLYRTDPEIMKANATCFRQISGDADVSQRNQAIRELVADLNLITDTDMDSIQNMNNFYSFDRQKAKEEIAYRKALKSWLNSLGDNVDLQASLPRSNN